MTHASLNSYKTFYSIKHEPINSHGIERIKKNPFFAAKSKGFKKINQGVGWGGAQIAIKTIGFDCAKKKPIAYNNNPSKTY